MPDARVTAPGWLGLNGNFMVLNAFGSHFRALEIDFNILPVR